MDQGDPCCGRRMQEWIETVGTGRLREGNTRRMTRSAPSRVEFRAPENLRCPWPTKRPLAAKSPPRDFPLIPLLQNGFFGGPTATNSGEIPIISQIARIL